MNKEEIYVIFDKGIDFGIKHGVMPKESLFNHFEELTTGIDRKAKSVLWTVIIAGFNYGSNIRSRIKPDEDYIKKIFENLINSEPLEPDDNQRYAIKEKIQKILK